MHDSIFSDSFLIQDFTVLGLKLRNYAIGHEIALWKTRNPIVTQTGKGFEELPIIAKKVALANAVEVCCIKAPRFKLIWALRATKMNFAAEMAKFRDYRVAGSLDLPTTKQPRDKSVPYHYFGSPEPARLLNYVVSHHQILIKEHFDGSPLNFPMGLARILYTTQLETEGHIWVENWQDIEIKRKHEDFDKANPVSTLAVGEDAVQAAAEKWNREHPESPVSLMRDQKEQK